MRFRRLVAFSSLMCRDGSDRVCVRFLRLCFLSQGLSQLKLWGDCFIERFISGTASFLPVFCMLVRSATTVSGVP